ncbi:hypothetical protein MVES1_003517 [Malassezia vespertilionis]|uniref:DAGKc domain-containing protein n=1 Tax=Malassezia vespertilionis TaxID=2020962 RepID=A0A2N1J6Z9_9BASI|nr:uncharacterized protein MVES1_003517 [Malassezia vespertilionis]PKI82333.1 hypothetical protein MVES_003754 [Malassezia vespertilionis]WFD08147.1 hypothetical protein MVES1_003517 [Malassezia vespertilionis]
MSVHVVCNAAAGQQNAESVLKEYVHKYLDAWKAADRTRVAPTYHSTDPTHGAKQIGAALAREKAPLTLVVLGGDGTVHEALDGMQSVSIPSEIFLVIVPTGTANAMYHALFGTHPGGYAATDPRWRLCALQAFAASKSTQPLSLMRVTMGDTHLSCVVTSHALHAAILRDSESLRASHPGIERFKMAAEQNMVRWTEGELVLEPGTEPVQRYCPSKHTFVPVAALGDYQADQHGTLRIQGPFVYLTAMVVDRLEAAFVPAPFAGPRCEAALRRPSDMVDIVVLRPLRSPVVQKAIAQGDPMDKIHEMYAQGPLAEVFFEGMYKDGAHVSFAYDGDEDVAGEQAGMPVVEYFRAAAYAWRPAPTDPSATTTCVDGTIFHADATSVQVWEGAYVHAWC